MAYVRGNFLEAVEKFNKVIEVINMILFTFILSVIMLILSSMRTELSSFLSLNMLFIVVISVSILDVCDEV